MPFKSPKVLAVATIAKLLEYKFISIPLNEIKTLSRALNIHTNLISSVFQLPPGAANDLVQWGFQPPRVYSSIPENELEAESVSEALENCQSVLSKLVVPTPVTRHHARPQGSPRRAHAGPPYSSSDTQT